MSFFEIWLACIDTILIDRASLLHDDLDNYDFDFAYRMGYSPRRAAIEALFDITIEELL